MQRAFKFYRRSSEQGNAFGQVHLGWVIQDGDGITKDEVRGTELARLSAEQGNSLGQNNYGYSLQHGLGVAKDEAQAVK
jgi:TPR repeat protein